MAMAQAKKVAARLQAQNPGLVCEMVGITPSGDKDKKTPLWQMDVVGIFSHELDERLLAQDVDCVVHSFKDLGTERPKGIKMAALLPRDNPRDIILFNPNIEEKLKKGEEICIGTSSPRRMVQVPDFLSQALPQVGPSPRICTAVLRGNANSRIEKLKNPQEGAQKYDGIVLALAGLTRLLEDDAATAVTQQLLSGLKVMVLPLTQCPTAPGQGLVCVEVREGDEAMQSLMAPLHCRQTESQVQAEREILLRHGGGCHQRFGATQLHLPNLTNPVMLVRGENKDEERVDEDIWQAPDITVQAGTVWDGQSQGENLFIAQPVQADIPEAPVMFVTHARAMPEGFMPASRLWVSGVQTWFKLAKRGLWVEGCGEGFGIDFLKNTLAEPVLSLPPLATWKVLTHAGAVGHWPKGQAIATYQLTLNAQSPLLEDLSRATTAWWGSGTQYEYLGEQATHVTLHACGAGRTADTLRARGLNPVVFPSHSIFLKWLQDKAVHPQKTQELKASVQ